MYQLKTKRLFNFEATWTTYVQCMEIIFEGWALKLMAYATYGGKF